MIYTDNLFDEIIVSEVLESKKIRIISGYASSTMLEKVMKLNKNIEIELYIGMSYQGISKKDHKNYIRLSSEKVKVYYQISGKPTHMKIYEFISKDKNIVYTGSANFSENGFNYHRELLIQCDISIDQIIKYQEVNSILCTDKNVGEYITFFDNINDIGADQIFNETILNEHRGNQISIQLGDSYISSNKLQFISNKKRLLKNYYSPEDVLTFSAILDEKMNMEGEFSGINSALKGKTPYLVQTSSINFDKLFIVGKEELLVTNEGIEFKVMLQGNNRRKKLMFLSGNIYEYMRNKMQINEVRVLTNKDAEKYNGNKVKIYKNNDFYIFDFDK